MYRKESGALQMFNIFLEMLAKSVMCILKFATMWQIYVYISGKLCS